MAQFLAIAVLILLTFLVVGALIAATSLVRAFVLKTMWAWFIVPIFGLPPLGVAAALGVALTIQTFVPSPTPDDDDDDNAKKKTKTRKLVLRIVLTPVMTLLLGWVVHQFM